MVRTEPGMVLLPDSARTESDVLIKVGVTSGDRLSGDFPASMTVPPEVKGAKISISEFADEIELSAGTFSSRAGLKASLAQANLSRALRCSIATACGAPR